MNSTSRLDAEAVAELATALRGSIIQPGDPGYDDARKVRNGLIDRSPALIARCRGTADVAAAVNFAREQRLDLSVRGGAHNVAGLATNDGGIVIDLSEMRAVLVDPANRTAYAQGGATWGDIDRETQMFGLAAPGGVVSTTGIGGLTLQGGLGWLRRKYGASVDNVKWVEIVTADGQVRTASETENPDLFWAVRGAGNNFGVVTRFEFELHPVGPFVYWRRGFYSVDDAPQVLDATATSSRPRPTKLLPAPLLLGSAGSGTSPRSYWGKPASSPPSSTAAIPKRANGSRDRLRQFAEPMIDLAGTIPILRCCNRCSTRCSRGAGSTTGSRPI